MALTKVTGTVSNITAADVGLGNVTNESKATMFTNAALTGTPTATTAASLNSSTQIATTAYVQTAGQNSQGAKTVQAISAGVPSNATGNNGDIIYQY